MWLLSFLGNWNKKSNYNVYYNIFGNLANNFLSNEFLKFIKANIVNY